MKRNVALGLLGLALAAGLSSCGRESSPPPKPTPPAEKVWTPDDMAADPEGYFRWADQQLANQIQQRTQRLDTSAAKRKELGDRRSKFANNYDDMVNLEQRLSTAVRKADEEDHWPVSIAGRQLDKEHAKATLEETRRRIAERKPLVQSYDEALAKLDKTITRLREEIDKLTGLKDRVSVDLERYRIDKSNPVTEKMKETEQQIATYTKILGSLGEDISGALPMAVAPIDIQSLIK